MKQQKLLAAILCAAAPLAYAASNDETPGEIVVTATRLEQPLKQSLASTTVITQQDIRNSQATDVPTILKSVAGIEIVQSGGIGQQSSLFMRGTNSDHVLVLVDGVRIDSATSGTTALDQLMLDQVDHIEVVRGNASSLYGSSAIGGVVQIFTKRGKGAPAINASAGYGSLGTRRLSAGFGGEVESDQFNVQASNFKTDGVSAINPVFAPLNVNPGKDGYDNTSVSASLRHRFNADHSLSATALDSNGNAQFDNLFGVSTDVNTTKSKIQKFALASENRLADSWLSKLQLANGKDDSQAFLNGVQSSRFQTVTQQLAWQNTLQLNEHGQFLLGAERLTQQVTSTTAFTLTQRRVNSLLAGYTGEYGAGQVQANLRQDRYSDFGSANTGLLGYGYNLNEAWRATASYATAFKAPTFNDMYYPLSFGYQGNPQLQPERSHNTEVGAHYADGGQHIDVVYFNNSISNLIASNNAGTTVVNINKARIKGAELNYAGQFGDTGVKAALTSQSSRDATTNQPLLRRARLHGSLGVTQQLGNWQVGGEWLYSSSREDNYFDPNTFTSSRQTLSGYNVFNLTAAYAFSKVLKLSVRASNLTNQNDSGVYGYNPLGRTLFASLNYKQ